jgi:hypothetical protein
VGVACQGLVLDADRVIAIEVARTMATVRVGDTVRIAARALNAQGAPVTGASISWAIVDTGITAFTIDGSSGLITGQSPGVGRVQAAVETLRSDPLTVTVTP